MRGRNRHLIPVLLTLSLIAAPALAAPKASPAKPGPAKSAGSGGLTPEVLSAKAFLEDLMIRRYSQKLATKVQRDSFTLGAQLDLIEAPQAGFRDTKEPLEERPADLLVGTLDPEDLIRRYGGSEAPSLVRSMLDHFRIRGAAVSVGLREELGPEVKAEVEKWLTVQLQSEFGKSGTSTVSLIRGPVKKEPKPEGFWDLLSQFQALAGQIVLALALLLGTLLWRLLAKRDTRDQQASPPISITQSPGASAANSPGGPLQGRQQWEIEEPEQQRLSEQIGQLTAQIVTLFPKLKKEHEGIIRSWCSSGEEGYLKVACLAEAVGKELGRLPIPVDAIKDVSRTFLKMHELGLKPRYEALRKGYWDLLAVLNLGPESLEQPFGYLGGLNASTVSQFLMEQNPRMKSLVALHMPDSLLERYVGSIPPESKRDLIVQSSKLNEVTTDELRSVDGEFKGKISPQGSKDVVALRSSFRRLLDSLSPLDQLAILPDLSGEAFDEYKRSTASIAYLKDWPDEPFTVLLAEASPDELIVLARVSPALQERIQRFAPPMTVELMTEELARADKTSAKDKNKLLAALREKMQAMVSRRSVDLEEIFPLSNSPEQSRDTDVKKAA